MSLSITRLVANRYFKEKNESFRKKLIDCNDYSAISKLIGNVKIKIVIETIIDIGLYDYFIGEANKFFIKNKIKNIGEYFDRNVNIYIQFTNLIDGCSMKISKKRKIMTSIREKLDEFEQIVFIKDIIK